MVHPSLVPIPFVLVDDQRLNLQGPNWDRRSGVDGAYADTISVVNVTAAERNIHGIVLDLPRWSELRLVGRPSADLRFMNYTLDGRFGVARVNSLANSLGKDGAVIWNLTSSSANSRIAINPHAGSLNLDYVAYRPETPRVDRGDVVLLDNAHPYIEYSDHGWTNMPGNVTVPIGLPFSGRWTVGRKCGASFAPRLKVQFRGSRVAVYGALNYAAGNLAMVYTVDGSSSQWETYFLDPREPDPGKWKFGLLYERRISDIWQSHELEIWMHNCTQEQAFYLDYISYDVAIDGQSTAPPFPGGISPSTPGPLAREGREEVTIGVSIASAVSAMLIALGLWRFYVRRKAQREGVGRRGSYELQEQLQSQVEREPLPPWSPPENPEGDPPPPEFQEVDPAISHLSAREGAAHHLPESPPTYSLSSSRPPSPVEDTPPPAPLERGNGLDRHSQGPASPVRRGQDIEVMGLEGTGVAQQAGGEAQATDTPGQPESSHPPYIGQTSSPDESIRA